MANEADELRQKITETLDELTRQAQTLETRISLLPEEHALRRQTEMSLASVRKELEKTKSALSRAETEVTLREISTTRRGLETLTSNLGKRFLEIEAVILASPMGMPEKVKKMAEEVDALRDRIAATTLALGYGMPMGMAWKRLYEDRLWEERAAKGEVEITESLTSARNKFQVWKHIPTGESIVRVEPQ
jgi:vacuolar-type H+-ATPase subunit I/STV1